MYTDDLEKASELLLSKADWWNFASSQLNSASFLPALIVHNIQTYALIKKQTGSK